MRCHARLWGVSLWPAAFCLCGMFGPAATSAFASSPPASTASGESRMPWQNGIWQHQAKAAIRMAERTAGRYGWHIAIIAAGSARDDGATRIELAKVRRWARATPPSGKASLKVARMIAGAQKTARPAWQANEPGGSAESFPFGSGGDVCVIRLTSNGTSLPEALATAFSTKAVDELAQFGGLAIAHLARTWSLVP